MTYVKYKSGKNSTDSALKGVINYCLQPYKTQIGEQLFCTSGKDCTPELAYKQFMATKAAFGKTDGVSFYHYVQSFSPKESVTPEEANHIALELADEWKGHEVLVSTHIDKAHIHSHILINSVSFETGLKLRQSPKTLEQLRKRSDEICIAHGLSTLKPYEKTKVGGVKTGEYRTAERGDSWKFRLCSAINRAMDLSWSKEQFIEYMRQLGYDVRWTDERKSITYTCLCEPKFKDGSYRKCRDNKLHNEKYLKENMEEEFNERAKLYAEIVAGGTDETQYSDRDSGTDTAHRSGDSDRGMGHAHGYDYRFEGAEPFASRPEQASGTGTFNNEIGNGTDGQTGIESCFERTEGGNNANGQADSGHSKRTGWESSRESFKANQQTVGSGRISVVAPPRAHRGSRALGTALVGAGWLGNLIDDDVKNKTPEEIEAEERARQSGSAVGLILGVAIGVVTALSSDKSDVQGADEQLPDKNDSTAIGNSDGENEGLTNQNGYSGPILGGM